MKIKLFGMRSVPSWTKWLALSLCSEDGVLCKLVAYSTRPTIAQRGEMWEQSSSLIGNRAKVLGSVEKPQDADWRDCLWHISEDPEMGPETYYLSLPGPTQPAFESVPRWATRVAQNADGIWWAYEYEPTKIRHQGRTAKMGRWVHNEGRRTMLGTCATKTIWSKQLYTVVPPEGLYIIPERIPRRTKLSLVGAAA